MFYLSVLLYKYMDIIQTENKTKEDKYMKTTTLNKMEFPLAPYPNAATKREVMHKIIDHLLMIACSAGVAAVILLMVALA